MLNCCHVVVTDFAAGDITCINCGEVLCSKIIDERAEWRTFNDSNRSDQRRASALSKGGGADTILIGGNEKLRVSLSRSSVMTNKSEEKKFDICISIVTDLAHKLKLNDRIVNQAVKLYKESLSRGLTKQKSQEPLAATVLYLACRLESSPRTLAEISKLSNVDKKVIGKLSSCLTRSLDIKAQCIQPESLVIRLGGQLHISFGLSEVARQMCMLISENDIIDSSAPQTIALAAIMLVCEMSGKSLKREDVESVSLASYSVLTKVKSTLESCIDLIRPAGAFTCQSVLLTAAPAKDMANITTAVGQKRKLT